MDRYRNLDSASQQFHLMLTQVFAQTAIDSGSTALKQAAFSNMGGVTAVLAFAGTKGLDPHGRLVIATVLFCVGLISSMIAMGASYHSSMRAFGEYMERHIAGKDPLAGRTKFVKCLCWCSDQAATAFGWFSLGFFIAGACFAGVALYSLAEVPGT